MNTIDISIPRGDADGVTVSLNDLTSGESVAVNLAGWKIKTSTKRCYTDTDSDAVIPLKEYTVPSSSQSGTGTISSSGVTITGTGTAFSTQLSVGDTITASSQTRTITAIASDTSMTVDSAFSSSLSGVSFTYIEAVFSYDITWSKTETDISPGNYVYDIRFISPDGDPTTVIGNYTITNTVTRSNS